MPRGLAAEFQAATGDMLTGAAVPREGEPDLAPLDDSHQDMEDAEGSYSDDSFLGDPTGAKSPARKMAEQDAEVYSIDASDLDDGLMKPRKKDIASSTTSAGTATESAPRRSKQRRRNENVDDGEILGATVLERVCLSVWIVILVALCALLAPHFIGYLRSSKSITATTGMPSNVDELVILLKDRLTQNELSPEEMERVVQSFYKSVNDKYRAQSESDSVQMDDLKSQLARLTSSVVQLSRESHQSAAARKNAVDQLAKKMEVFSAELRGQMAHLSQEEATRERSTNKASAETVSDIRRRIAEIIKSLGGAAESAEMDKLAEEELDASRAREAETAAKLAALSTMAASGSGAGADPTAVLAMSERIETLSSALKSQIDAIARKQQSSEKSSQSLESLSQQVKKISEEGAAGSGEKLKELQELVANLKAKVEASPAGAANSQEVETRLSEFSSSLQELDGKLSKLAANDVSSKDALTQQFDEAAKGLLATQTAKLQEKLSQDIMASLTEQMQQLIKEALDKFSADKTAMVDFALKHSGGRIVFSTPTHVPKDTAPAGNNKLVGYFSTFVSVLPGTPSTPARSAEEMISPDNAVGRCWPMAGTKGFAIILLRQKVVPSHVSVEHVAKSVVPDPSTAPKGFRVWAVEDGALDAAKKLSPGELPTAPITGLHHVGDFSFDIDAGALQTYLLKNVPADRPLQYIRFEVLSNHGHKSYTCIYRVRVHANA